jgi:phosphopentomutase
MIDQVVTSLIDSWDHQHDLLIITSDHGNIEEKNHRQHSRNPVPTILIGPNHAQLALKINDLAGVAEVVRIFLELPDNPG